MPTPVNIRAPGAWMVRIRYVGPNREARYPFALQPRHARRVSHLTDLAGYVDGTEVERPLIDVAQTEFVPGARWDPDYEWPAEPAPAPPFEAPTQHKVNFLGSASRVLLDLTPEVGEHIRTHDLGDSVVEAYADLMAALRGVRDGP